jgi:hypothetical protein
MSIPLGHGHARQQHLHINGSGGWPDWSSSLSGRPDQTAAPIHCATKVPQSKILMNAIKMNVIKVDVRAFISQRWSTVGHCFFQD